MMIRPIEEGDTKGGIIIPKDKFKDLWSCERGVSKCGMFLRIGLTFCYLKYSIKQNISQRIIR